MRLLFDFYQFGDRVMGQSVRHDSQILNLVNRSGTITAASVAQDLAAENLGRRGFWIQNLGTTPIYFNFGTDAVAGQPSFRLDGGAMYETPTTGCPTGRISVICATISQAFSAKEF